MGFLHNDGARKECWLYGNDLARGKHFKPFGKSWWSEEQAAKGALDIIGGTVSPAGTDNNLVCMEKHGQYCSSCFLQQPLATSCKQPHHALFTAICGSPLR